MQNFGGHMLQQNANQYFFIKQYVSIHSEDRNIINYPNSTEFEIELPQDYKNVASARLYSWAFPSNYSLFSQINKNITLTFTFKQLYQPSTPDPINNAIFDGLNANINNSYSIQIEEGFYDPNQMAKELTNKLNTCVTDYLLDYFYANPAYSGIISTFIINGYDRFSVAYNLVSQNLWFGNGADRFELNNGSILIENKNNNSLTCVRQNILPEEVNWGLPYFLGFSRCDVLSYSTQEYYNDFGIQKYKYETIPKFDYEDHKNYDNWIQPSADDSTVYFLHAFTKINFLGQSHFYMEIDGFNAIDETNPWNLSKFTAHNNITNGVVNSAFAKISIPVTPTAQWFDDDQGPYKYFNPPLERVRKLKIKLRYHNGQNVDFGSFNYSFMLEFNILTPQLQSKYSIRDSYGLGQIQG